MTSQSSGCLFPKSNASGLQVHQCTPETCAVHPIYSVVSARCLGNEASNTTSTMPTFSRDFEFPSSNVIQTRCMVNRTTEVFYWFPPVQNCFSNDY
uniref:SUEL-type lectin domain-containing protein n=1 Tax=Mesocestoides corti TaxID=53468 RepID=A0A5K3FY69_MESCO